MSHPLASDPAVASPDLLRFHQAANAPARLAAVRATGLLDTPVEAAFDRFTSLAHRLLGVPVCLLTLVTEERDFVKSAIGLPEPLATMRAVPTGAGQPSFCQFMVAEDAPLAVDDARAHPLFSRFPSVTHGGAAACAGAPLRGPDGQPLGTLCVVDLVPRQWSDDERAVILALAEAASTEIALRMAAAEARAALEEREAVLRQFIEHAPAAVAMVDRELRYVAASRRWQRDHALGDASVEGRRHDELVRHLPEGWPDEYARVLAGEVREGEDAELRYPDGRVEQLRYELHPWRSGDGDVRGMLMLTEIVTERRRMERALAHHATHDALTGLPNRALLEERIGRALERSRAGRASTGGDGVALLFVDLDDFKNVNDTLGHAAGDRLIRGVAERLLAATRGFDTVARLGGDEFAVLLEGLATLTDADVVVGRILRALSAPLPVGPSGEATVAGASIGIAHAVLDHDTPGLLRDADVAMYRAKAAGKGRYAVFDPAMEEARRERMLLEAELRQLLAVPDATHPAYGALALVFQPVVELSDGRATSVEALVRWHHPARGVISPAAFIPMAEESGLIVALGRWVTEAACRQLAHWEATLPDDRVPAVAVNLSGRQLEHPDLVSEVAHALHASGVRRDRVTLEITETALAANPEAARDVLTALHALGVRLAIDDFGTGYSSLGYLQQFPVDVLKIDKRFVDGVAGAGSDAALARTIIALADALGMRTVAEGVEQEAQHHALRTLGCSSGQGFLFARPMPPAELDAWLCAGAEPVRAAEEWAATG